MARPTTKPKYRSKLEERRAAFEESYVPVPETGCWLWTKGGSKKGYGMFSTGGSANSMSAHRASWVINKSEIPDNMHVLHKCDVKCCVNPDHLYLGDQVQNNKDRKERTGYLTVAKGEKVGGAKLNEKQVVEIRDLLSKGFKQRDIAKIYGVDQTNIKCINKRQTWKHV